MGSGPAGLPIPFPYWKHVKGTSNSGYGKVTIRHIGWADFLGFAWVAPSVTQSIGRLTPERALGWGLASRYNKYLALCIHPVRMGK